MSLAVAAGVALDRALAFDAPADFWRQKGNIVAVSGQSVPVEEPEQAADSLYLHYRVEIRSTAGYRLRGYLRTPRRAGRWPALIVLGGIDTGKRAATLIQPRSPYVILGLDYPWTGPTHLTARTFLLRLTAIRRAMLLTPSALMLAADYLRGRPDIDGRGVTLVGASFGAPLATVAAALDPAFGALVLVYGGGDFRRVIAANLGGLPTWLRGTVAWIGDRLTRPVDPLRYISRLAPRPVVLINGRDDRRIPRESVEALYDAARPPKRLVWLETGHIRPQNSELLKRVLEAATVALADLERSPDDQ